MWKLKTSEEIVDAHGLWFKEVGNVGIGEVLQPGHVLVTSTGGAKEVGFWGSANSMGIMAAGAVGIVTDGYARDTAELTLQKTPVCARARGRTIIPGRIEVVEVQATVGCGGAQVRPGDIVGCDDDGVVVVPLEVAEEVAVHARAVLLNDMRDRRELYKRVGLTPDPTVDYEAVQDYYRQFQ
jgi:regulator of RNase E activity RraA